MLLRQEYSVVRDRTKLQIIEAQLMQDLERTEKENSEVLQLRERYSNLQS